MLKVNFEGAIETSIIDKYHDKVFHLATKMEEFKSIGSDFLGWKDWPEKDHKKLFEKIKSTVKFLKKENVTTLVVIGIGGSYIGAKAAIEMIRGQYPNDQGMEIIFIGESISSSSLFQKLIYLSKKDFAVNVISKSGTTLEPAIAFRFVKEILEKKVGKYNARKYIFATTDSNKGTLLNFSTKNEYQTFDIPENIGGRFSVLTAVGLFPIACSGIDIEEIMKGAKEANNLYKNRELTKNDAYKYAVTRHYLFHKKKFPIELMVQYEPQMQAFSEWWKQLSGESEGKNNLGLFPASAVFSTDLHSLGQFIQDGSKVLFETMLFFKNPKINMEIVSNEDNFDKLNYLTNFSIHKINESMFLATKDAHNKIAKVPLIEIVAENFSPKTFGYLVVFFERAVAMTGYLLNVNPFNQPGVEIYKQNLQNILKNISYKN